MKWVAMLFFVGAVLAIDNSPEENNENGGSPLFEGDMILSKEEISKAENGEDLDTDRKRGARKFVRWPRGELVYDFDQTLTSAGNLGGLDAIKEAMEEWTSKTNCIRFKKRTNEQAYVKFVRYSSAYRNICASSVGRTGWQQLLHMDRGCWTRGIVAHEIGHALGFFHEQSRPDRDNYVTIKWENIKTDARHNFNKYGRQTIDSLGSPYDYGSIMHYGSNFFTKNGQPTIVPKQAGAVIGNREGLSAIDAQQADLYYMPDCQARPACEDKTTSGSCCASPFQYRGVTYYSCTSVEHDRPWCSLDAVYSGRWENCAASGCQPQTTSKRCCAIPFEYLGVVYNSCTSANHNRLWCSLDHHYKESWGDCS